jgi:hypothetical protein
MAQSDLNRPLAPDAGHSPSQQRTMIVKLTAGLVLVLGLGFGVSRMNLRRDMSRLDVGILSGTGAGNYHHLVDRLAQLAATEKGKVRNVASDGSADNVRKLAAAATGCDVAIGLAQDGTAWGEPRPQLLGRLPKAESVLFFGKNADRIKEFAQLAHLKIGIGPEGSGAAVLAGQLLELPELRALEMTLSHHPLVEQLELAEKGELDLAVLVMDEDAELVKSAVVDRGLQLAGFAHADVIARRIPHLRTGRIGAGEYDPVKLLPPEDKRVLRVETLVLGNGCAGRSQTIDVMLLLSRQFPEFIRFNKDTPNATGLELTATAREFFEHGGPEVADEYVPWLVDVMPPANWAYAVMGVSLLFNAMGFGHRFRLWRLDAARVGLETELTKLFGASATVEDIARAATLTGPEGAERGQKIEQIITGLERLSARSRRYSLSMLVPMGQEMAYRYQEELMHQTLAALRGVQQRSAAAP